MSEIYTPPPAARPISDPRQTALIFYILMLVPIVIPITHIVGLVMAYVSRDTAPEWLKSHYTFQIRTFWIGLLYWTVSIVLCVVLIGAFGILATIIWGIVRCALGLNRLLAREPYPNPESWIT